eukprot:GEMP01082765.1.p1 GENE.GEMP01082765.1~~GEMP01082765.1.p1  ORF type:complete len:134 (+),score=25.80 GEMP01082765.1:25-426(+)
MSDPSNERKAKRWTFIREAVAKQKLVGAKDLAEAIRIEDRKKLLSQCADILVFKDDNTLRARVSCVSFSAQAIGQVATWAALVRFEECGSFVEKRTFLVDSSVGDGSEADDLGGEEERDAVRIQPDSGNRTAG